MYTLKIRVTKEILEQTKTCGLPGSETEYSKPFNCPVAIAIRDVFPTAAVCCERIWTSGWPIELPIIAQEFIYDFDHATSPEKRMNMPAIEFEIEIPDEILETINIDEVKELLKDHPTLEFV